MEHVSINEARELSAAAYLALHLAIYGGDPSPERLAKEVILLLSSQLEGSAGKQIQTELLRSGATLPTHSLADVKGGLSRVGIELAAQPDGSPLKPRQFCFKFHGKTFCIILPRVRLEKE